VAAGEEGRSLKTGARHSRPGVVLAALSIAVLGMPGGRARGDDHTDDDRGRHHDR